MGKKRVPQAKRRGRQHIRCSRCGGRVPKKTVLAYGDCPHCGYGVDLIVDKDRVEVPQEWYARPKWKGVE